MAGVYAFFECVAEAIMAKGIRGLAGLVPFGEQIYAVGEDAVKRWRMKKQLHEQQQAIRKEFEQAAQSKLDQFEQDMRQLVAQVSDRQPAEVRQQLTPQLQEALTAYLTLIPERIRQTFARPADPTGTTVPATWALARPEDLLPLLPPRPPRFKGGEAVPNTSGKYVLEQRLGIGGFGEVWKARHTQRKNIFAAFKFCLDPTAHQRILEHEAEIIDQVLTQAEHPNIVKLIEVDLQGDTPWLQYEYVNGGDLAGFVGSWTKDLPQRAALATRVLRVLARTAAFCHGLKPPIVHRDFKPSNVLLARDPNGDARLKVTDFGISDTLARSALDEARRVTVASVSASTPSLLRWAHTPLYASPQQKEGADPHPGDDVHALGVMWYQLLLGNTNLALGVDYERHLKELGLCEELLEVLSRSIASDPTRRYPNAAELAHHLDNLPAELVPGRKTHMELFDRQLDALFADADQKNAQARQQLDHRDYAAAVTTLETIRSARMRDPELYTRAVQFRDGKLFTNNLGMEFALVPRGTFWMGGGGGTPGDKQVEIPYDFYFGVYPITQEQWQAVMGSNPSYFARSGGGKNKVTNVADADLKRFPVEHVSWQDAQQFLQKINAKEKDSGWTYTLPREAEWEYACRGGATSPEDCAWHFYFDQPTNELTSRQANFAYALERTSKVGSYRPNRLGIHDLHGNIWEWCEDLYDGGPDRVFRGGSWGYAAERCRAAYRGRLTPGGLGYNHGLRLARVSVGR